MKPIICADMMLVSDMDELYLPLSELLSSPLYHGVPPYQVKRWYESSVIEQLTPFPHPSGGMAYSLHQCQALVNRMRLRRALELRHRCTRASTRRTTIPWLPQQEEAVQGRRDGVGNRLLSREGLDARRYGYSAIDWPSQQTG